MGVTRSSTTPAPATTPSEGPVIELQDIAKSYALGKEGVAALQGVSISIHKGEYVAIMGPSGSGKSTLMNIIGCLDNPSRGTYRLAGEDVSRLPETELARVRNREIGFIFQSFNLLPRATAIENVALPLVYGGVSARERLERATAALEAVGVGDRKGHRPSELSGGQCQRVAIARALATRPRLLLADEPTGNLDSQTAEEILAIFDAIHEQGNTIVLVTHDDDVARRASRILRLRDGLIVADETRAGREAPGSVPGAP